MSPWNNNQHLASSIKMRKIWNPKHGLHCIKEYRVGSKLKITLFNFNKNNQFQINFNKTAWQSKQSLDMYILQYLTTTEDIMSTRDTDTRNSHIITNSILLPNKNIKLSETISNSCFQPIKIIIYIFLTRHYAGAQKLSLFICTSRAQCRDEDVVIHRTYWSSLGCCEPAV